MGLENVGQSWDEGNSGLGRVEIRIAKGVSGLVYQDWEEGYIRIVQTDLRIGTDVSELGRGFHIRLGWKL